MGGAWLGILLPLYLCGLFSVLYCAESSDSSGSKGGSTLLAIISLVGSDPGAGIAPQCVKYIQNIIALTFVAVFAFTSFECAICADSVYRRFDNDNDNNRMAIYFVMGSVSFLSEVVCFAILRGNDAIQSG